MLDKYETEEWINCLGQALCTLAQAQQPFLEEYWLHSPPKHAVFDAPEVAPFSFDNLCRLYFLARDSSFPGGEAHYAPLRSAIDPVRGVLRLHPTLARVLGRSVGSDEFWIQMLGHGHRTSLTDLIGGLMTRANELPGGDFRAAAGELHAFLDPARRERESATRYGLDIAYDAVLFHGLQLEGELDIGGGLTMLPFEQARTFLGEKVLADMAPEVVTFRDWRLVGVMVRPFRWKPEFRPGDDVGEAEPRASDQFGQDALEYLRLLAVSHRVPIVCLAEIRECLHRSSCHLLGQAHHHGALRRGRAMHRFDPWSTPPQLRTEAFAKAQEVFESRQSDRYVRLAPVVSRLAEALARDGRFAVEDRILDVAIALERMYELGGGEISHKLRTRASWFLGEDADSRLGVMKSVAEFYGVRSDIVHNRNRNASAERYGEVFNVGFDVAARTLLRLLRDGLPGDWEQLVVAAGQ